MNMFTYLGDIIPEQLRRITKKETLQRFLYLATLGALCVLNL